jgi:hypothetical protein
MHKSREPKKNGVSVSERENVSGPVLMGSLSVDVNATLIDSG